MIGRYVLALFEVKTIYLVGSIEHTVDLYAVDIEIRFYLVVCNVEEFLLHLCGIVESVVGLQLEVITLQFLSVFFDSLGLCLSLGSVFLDELSQEAVHVLTVLRHGLLERVVGIVVVAHELSLLGTQLGYFGNDREGVELWIGGIGTMDTCLVHTAAKVAVSKRGEDRLLGGVDDYHAVRSLTATALCVFLALSYISIAQASQLVLALYPYHSIVGGCRQEVVPLLLQLRDAGVDLLHALHLLCRQQGARANKTLVGLLGQAKIFALEFLQFVVVNELDAVEELLVERNLVVQIGKQRHHLLLSFGNARSFVGAGESEEDVAHTVEQESALFESEDGVLEGWFLLVVDNLLDVLTLAIDGYLEGRKIVALLNLAEIGSAERQSALYEKRIMGGRTGTSGLGKRSGRHLQEGSDQAEGK